MPFVSDKQRKWMHIHHPGMARRWDRHTPKGKRLPRHVDEEELAVAAMRGPVAVAELVESSRAGAVALVVVPAEPPGRGLCDFLRRVAASSPHVVVAASGGRLAPGNLERLLRVSVPDVESELFVVDASTDGGLSAAIEAAEREGAYRPGQALEAFCWPDALDGMRAELEDGALSVDPTVVQLRPIEARRDDSDGIVRAVHSGDAGAMERLLDPHVFSSGGVDEYRAVLFSEGLMRGPVLEFLSDVASSRELAIARLHDLLAAEMGDDKVGTIQYLGTGRNGSAYRHPDGFILKVTTDPVEARSGRRLVGVDSPHLGRIFHVRSLAEGVWLIIQEDLRRLPPRLAELFDGAMGVIESALALDDLNAGQALDALERLRGSVGPTDLRRVAGVLRRFDVVGMCRELRRLGLTADFHSGNMMLRGSTPVLTDLGTPGDDPGTLREFGSGAPGSGAAGPATMRGSNSSSWSNGRGALKAPRSHIPEDENEREGDRALDWGPGRVSGASM